MKAARALRYARRKAGLTQRGLAEKTGLPQSTIGRIEAGLVDPRVGTLSRLLRACGFDLEVEPRLGVGVDRSLFQSSLPLSPAERIAHNVEFARFTRQLRAAARVRKSRVS